MKSVSLVMPGIPKLLRDLVSQFKWRQKHILISPVFDVPEIFHANVEKDEGHARIEHIRAEIVGSYENRVIWTQGIRCHQFKYTTAREWIDGKFKVVKMGTEQFILQDWPALKVRPFPDESFHLVLTFPMNHKVKIPYFPIPNRS